MQIIASSSNLSPIAEEAGHNLKGHSTATPGLSLNPHQPNPKQPLQLLLNNDQTLKDKIYEITGFGGKIL